MAFRHTSASSAVSGRVKVIALVSSGCSSARVRGGSSLLSGDSARIHRDDGAVDVESPQQTWFVANRIAFANCGKRPWCWNAVWLLLGVSLRVCLKLTVTGCRFCGV